MVFVEVGGKVVQAYFSVLDNHLPVGHTQRHHVGFVEFPVEELVLLLLPVLAAQGLGKGNAVEPLFCCAGLQAVSVAVEPGIVKEGGHEVVERQLVVVYRSGWHITTPGDEGDADAALVGGTLYTPEQAVAVEPVGVGATLCVRSVVRCEDDQRILCQSLLFQFLQYFAHLCVQAGNHGGKLGVAVCVPVVPRPERASKGAVIALELMGVMLQDAVVRLPQFGMGKGVGEDAEEGFVLALAVYPFQCIAVDEVGRVLCAVFIIGMSATDIAMVDVLL